MKRLPAYTTTVVQGNPRGAPERITDKIVHRHVCSRKEQLRITATVKAHCWSLTHTFIGDFVVRNGKKAHQVILL